MSTNDARKKGRNRKVFNKAEKSERKTEDVTIDATELEEFRKYKESKREIENVENKLLEIREAAKANDNKPDYRSVKDNLRTIPKVERDKAIKKTLNVVKRWYYYCGKIYEPDFGLSGEPIGASYYVSEVDGVKYYIRKAVDGGEVNKSRPYTYSVTPQLVYDMFKVVRESIDPEFMKKYYEAKEIISIDVNDNKNEKVSLKYKLNKSEKKRREDEWEIIKVILLNNQAKVQQVDEFFSINRTFRVKSNCNNILSDNLSSGYLLGVKHLKDRSTIITKETVECSTMAGIRVDKLPDVDMLPYLHRLPPCFLGVLNFNLVGKKSLELRVETFIREKKINVEFELNRDKIMSWYVCNYIDEYYTTSNFATNYGMCVSYKFDESGYVDGVRMLYKGQYDVSHASLVRVLNAYRLLAQESEYIIKDMSISNEVADLISKAIDADRDSLKDQDDNRKASSEIYTGISLKVTKSALSMLEELADDFSKAVGSE